MSEPDAGDVPSPFGNTFPGDDVEQRIYGTILQTRSQRRPVRSPTPPIIMTS